MTRRYPEKIGRFVGKVNLLYILAMCGSIFFSYKREVSLKERRGVGS